jgi:hypothetical protein
MPKPAKAVTKTQKGVKRQHKEVAGDDAEEYSKSVSTKQSKSSDGKLTARSNGSTAASCDKKKEPVRENSVPKKKVDSSAISSTVRTPHGPPAYDSTQLSTVKKIGDKSGTTPCDSTNQDGALPKQTSRTSTKTTTPPNSQIATVSKHVTSSGHTQGDHTITTKSSAKSNYDPRPLGVPIIPRQHGHGGSTIGDPNRSTTTSSNQRTLISTMVRAKMGAPDQTRSNNSPLLSLAHASSIAPTIPSNIVQSSGKGVDESSCVTEHITGLYQIQEKDQKKEQEERLRNLKEYVRNHLFPYWKFFSSKKQMAFTDKKGGIVLKICNDLHVRKESRIYWWDMNKKAILSALNRKRNDVTAYLKKHFCRKYIYISLVLV